MTATYAEAKNMRDFLQSRVNNASIALQRFSKGEYGLTPDSVKLTPEWKSARNEFSVNIAALQNFNKLFTKMFKKEILAERRNKA